MDTRSDLLISIGVAVLGLAVLFMTSSIRLGLARDVIGPRAFPYVIGTFLFCAGVVLSVIRLRNMHATGSYNVPSEGSPDASGYPASSLRVLFFVVLTATYCFLLQPAGYLLVTPAFMACAFLAMGERRVMLLVVAPIIWTLVTYSIFSQVLSVRLPVGPFAPLFRELGLILL